MDSTIDDLLAAVSDGAPCLVALGQAARSDGKATTYAWSNGRVLATVAEGKVTLTRRWGVISEPNRITLTEADLTHLGVACANWMKERDSWAACFETGAGYPPGWGCSGIFYLPPGKDSARVKIGERALGALRGQQLQGRNVIRRLRAPKAVTAGVRVTARMYRANEVIGPARALTGLRYELEDGLRLRADRFYLKISRGSESLLLETGEEAFVSSLAGVMAS